MRPYLRRAVAAVATAGLTLVTVATTTAGAPPGARPSRPAESGAVPGGGSGSRRPAYLDRRILPPAAQARPDRTRQRTGARAPSGYLRSLGQLATVDLDPLTGTPRVVGRVDGYLSGPDPAPARRVALAYVSAHLADLGLRADDLATLRLRRDYVDDLGVHHLSWIQRVDGVPVFGNGLQVTVTRSGRVLTVGGSPVSGLADLARGLDLAPVLGPARARRSAAADVGARPLPSDVASRGPARTRWSNQDYAARVLFLTPGGLRPAWSTYVQTSTRGSYQHVVDAADGRVLYRRTTTADDRGDGYVYETYPGAPRAGRARVVNLIRRGWLNPRASFLRGTSVTTWDDLNDDNAINRGETTRVPGNRRGATFRLRRFRSADSALCRGYVCSWDPATAYSWRANRDADAVNAFYLASNFHDYLARPPISFTPAAGSFDAAGRDPVLLNALDGADTTGDGFPDPAHVDNANMSTPPDGTSPTMQMYLFHAPGATDDDEPLVATSSSLAADVEYHEYTHGLSNRLVVDATGNSTLSSIQAGSMGEAWSDYYALDYLVGRHLVADSRAAGEVLEGAYVTGGAGIRTEAIDCPVGATATACTRLDGTTGGYTYGDFATVIGVPEVHASGEIWAQTLWDLRSTLGRTVADRLITRAMSLSPADPTFLDERNAILQADLVAYRGRHTATLWRLFAARGMGFFAGTLNGGDTAPVEDFHVPPRPGTPRSAIAGTVTDLDDGTPVAGVAVTVTGLNDRYSAVTAADGTYRIGGVFAGTYPVVSATGAGYVPQVASVTVPTAGPVDFAVRRDWAAASGGATVVDFDGPDYTPFGCGPSGAIDLSLGSGWGSTTGDDDGTPTNVFVPKHLTVDLGATVDLTGLGVDPSATCGDAGSASTGAFRVEASPDGSTWSTIAEGAFTADDRGRVNPVPVSGDIGGVTQVRFTMLGNQTPDFATNCPAGAFSGCQFTDLTELEVFGTPVG